MMPSKKYGLAIHTTSPDLGLAIAAYPALPENEDRLLYRSGCWNLGRELAKKFQQHLSEFIEPQNWSELAFLAVAIGPGSFTGTRIGVTASRTLAQQLQIPLFGISSLAAIARFSVADETQSGESFVQQDSLPGTLSGKKTGAIAIQMPAQRGQLFVAIYKVDTVSQSLTNLFPDSVLAPEAWQKTLDNWSTPYQLISIPAGAGLGNSASAVLELAYLDWQQGLRPDFSEALPFYGQNPV